MLHILYWEFHMDRRVGCSFKFIQALIDDSHGMAWHGGYVHYPAQWTNRSHIILEVILNTGQVSPKAV